MTKNESIYSGQLKHYLADWHCQGGQFYALISKDVVINGEAGILIFDFKTKELKEQRIKDKIDSDKKLKVYNDPLKFTNCHCGE